LRAAEAEHLRQVRILEREHTADLVVGLIERAAGDEDANHLISTAKNAKRSFHP
jgi:hypothetical protein